MPKGRGISETLMNQALKQRIDMAVSKAEKAAEEWVKRNEDKIEYKVKQLLEQRVEEIIAKTVGFDACFGKKWEVDHCNGRQGESIIGDWIRENARETAKKWINEQIGNLPNLPATAISDLKKCYLEQLKEWTKELLIIEARENAEKMISQVIGKEFNYEKS